MKKLPKINEQKMFSLQVTNSQNGGGEKKPQKKIKTRKQERLPPK